MNSKIFKKEDIYLKVLKSIAGSKGNEKISLYPRPIEVIDNKEMEILTHI